MNPENKEIPRFPYFLRIDGLRLVVLDSPEWKRLSESLLNVRATCGKEKRERKKGWR